MRPQLRELDVSPSELGEQRRNRTVQRGYLHPHRAVLDLRIAHALERAEPGNIEPLRRPVGLR